MSSAIDRRIVEMQFDNKDFERNIETSQKSLEKLKESLDLDESAKSLDALEKAGKKFNLDHVADAAEVVKNKFSVLGTIGDQVLRRMTNAAYDMFSKLKGYAAMFTIDPIHTGFQEYETQIGAIQTIMSNTRWEIPDNAERLSRVNEQLDILNHYADQTIYNFTQMTESIGRFTAAGVGLDTSVSAIKGISNLAALLGARPDQASSAMYMFSQAISSGKMMAYQYNSLMHSGMQGKQFEDAILRAAKAHKTSVTVSEGKKKVQKNVYDWISSGGISLKDSLQHGWLTDDLLLEVLDQFSWGDFSQMTDEIRGSVTDENRQSIIDSLVSIYTGGKDPMSQKEALDKAHKLVDEATTLTKEDAKEIKKAQLLAQGYKIEDIEEMFVVAEEAQKAATQVKTFTQLIDVLKEAAQSGWTETWRYIAGDFEQAKELFTGLSDYFGEIIGDSANARNALMKEWSDRGGRGMLFNKDTDKGPLGALWNMIYGIRNLISAVKDEFRKIVPPATAETLLSITERIRDATARFYEWTQNSEGMEKLRTALGGVANLLGIVKDTASEVWFWFKNLFGGAEEAEEGTQSLAGSVLDLAANTGNWFTNLRKTLKESETIKKVLGWITPILQTIKETAVTVFTTVRDWFVKMWGKVKDSGIFEFLSIGFSKVSGWFTKLYDKIKGGNLFTVLSDGFKSVKEWFTNLWDKIKKAGLFEALSDGFKSVRDWFVKMWDKIKETKFFQTLSTWLQPVADWFKKVGNWFSEMYQKVRSSKFGTAVADGFKSVRDWFVKMWDKLKGSDIFGTIKGWFGPAWEWLKTAFGNVKEFLQPAIDRIKEIAGRLWEAIKSFFNVDVSGEEGFVAKLKARFQAFADSFNLSEIVEKLKGKVSEFVEKIKGMFDTKLEDGAEEVTSEKSGIGKFFSWIWTFLKATWPAQLAGGGLIAGTVFIAKTVLNFSKGIGNISASIKNLTKEGFDLKASAQGLQVHKDGKTPLSQSMLKIGIAIALLAASVYVLGTMDTKSLIQGILVLGGLMAGLIIMSKLMGKANFDGSGVLKAAGGIAVLVAAMWLLAKMNWDTIFKGMAALALVMGEMVIFSRLSSGKQTTDMLKSAGAILVLVIAMKALARMEWGGIVKGLVGLGAVMGEVIIFSKLTSNKDMKGMLSMAAALLLLTVTMKAISRMSWKSLLKGIVGLGLLMVEMALFTKMVKGIKISTAVSVMLIMVAMIAGLTAIVLAFKSLEGSDMDDLLKFSASISMLFLSMSIAMAVLSKIPIVGSLVAVANMAIFIGGLGAILVGLGYVATKWEGMSGFLDKGGDVLEKIGRAIGRFVGALTAGALGTLAKDLGDYASNVKGFEYDEDGSDNAVELAKSLNLFTKELPEESALVKFSPWGKSTLTLFSEGVKNFGQAMRAYAQAIEDYELGEINSKKNTEFINAAKEIARFAKSKDIPEVGFWTKFFGVETDFGQFGKDIKTMAQGMIQYSQALQTYGGSVKMVGGADVAENFLTTAERIATLASGNIPTSGFWTKIGLIDSDFAQFSQDIPELGEGVVAYAKEIKKANDQGLSDFDDTNFVNAAKAIAEFSRGPLPEHGFWDAMFGIDTDFKQFSEDLPAFAQGIIQYAETVNKSDVPDIDTTKNGKLVTAATEVGKLASSNVIPDTDFLTRIFNVGTDFAYFSRDLPAFAEGLAAYSVALNNAEVKEISATKNNNLLAAAKEVAKFGSDDAIPDQSIFERLSGVKTKLGTFAEDITTFASAMGTYAGEVHKFTETVEEDEATRFISVAQSLALLASAVPEEGVFARLGVLDTSFEAFVKGIGPFGEALKAYGGAIKGFSSEVTQQDVLRANSAIRGIARLTKDLGGDQEAKFASYASIGDHIGHFGTKFGEFKVGIQGSGETLTGIANVKAILDAIITLNSDEKYTQVFDLNRVERLLQSAMGLYIPEVTDDNLSRSEAAEKFLTNLASAIESSEAVANVTGAASGVGEAGAGAAKDTYITWYGAGQHLGTGLGRGLESQKGYVAGIARRIASDAVASVRSVWLVRSPSRVGQELGMYFDLGIANGLSEYSRVVSGNAAEMSQSVVDSASTMLTGVDTSIFDGLDPNPTIRPVMDLTNVQNGVGAINGMLSSDNFGGLGLFGGRPTLRGINALNLEGGRITGSFTDKNIVERLDGLQNRLGDLNEAITNMQIVLDSGTLVGATTSLIDDSLGTLAMRKERGN